MPKGSIYSGLIQSAGFKSPSKDGFEQFKINYITNSEEPISEEELREKYYFSISQNTGFEEYYTNLKKDNAEKYNGSEEAVFEAYVDFVHTKLKDTQEYTNERFKDDNEVNVFVSTVEKVEPGSVIPEDKRDERSKLIDQAQRAFVHEGFKQAVFNDESSNTAFWNMFKMDSSGTGRDLISLNSFLAKCDSFKDKSFETFAHEIVGKDKNAAKAAKEEFIQKFSSELSKLDDIPKNFSLDMSDADIVKNWGELYTGFPFFTDADKLLEIFKEDLIRSKLKESLTPKEAEEADKAPFDKLSEKFKDKFKTANEDFYETKRKCNRIRSRMSYLQSRIDAIANSCYEFADSAIFKKITNKCLVDTISGISVNDHAFSYFMIMSEIKQHKLLVINSDVLKTLRVKDFILKDLVYHDTKGNQLDHDSITDMDMHPGAAFSVSQKSDPYGKPAMLLIDPKGKVLINPDAEMINSYTPPKFPGILCWFKNLFKTQPEWTEYKKGTALNNSFKRSFAEMTERIAAVVNDNREKAKADCCSRIEKYSKELKTAFVNAENKELAFAKLLICSENKASVNSDPSSYKTEQEIEYQAHNRIKDPKFIYAFNEMFKGMTSSKDVETLMSGDHEKITALLTGKDCVYQNHVKVFKSKNIHPADNAASLNTDDHVNKEIHNEISPYIHS